MSLGAWEWARLAGFTAQSFRVGFAAVVALMLFVMYVLPGLAPWVLGASVLWWAVATYLVLTYPRSSEHWSSAATKLVIGLLILLPAWQGLVQIKQYPLGNWLIMAVMVLVWGADIGAYFSGRKFASASWLPQSARKDLGRRLRRSGADLVITAMSVWCVTGRCPSCSRA